MNDYISVSMLNAYINRVLDNDEMLQNFLLKGEISGFRLYQQSGHIYFTLKDEDAAVSCVMFRSKGQGLTFKPADGMEVLLRGSVSVFARQGKYQVYVEEMQPYGKGDLYRYLEQLKARLAAEGMFAQDSKKSIPKMAGRIGVVTSQDGAALRDIIKVLRQRHAGVEVVVAHSSVQGTEAPRELARGIELLNEYGEVDLIIVGRGGGSLEDLMAFNSEEVVYAIFHSRLPVISAVGHEVDYSLADLAADQRAATPTHAAQLAVPDYGVLQKDLDNLKARMLRFAGRALSTREERLDRIMMKRIWKEPLLLNKNEELLADKQKRLRKAMEEFLREKSHSLSMAVSGLDNLSPLKVMGRGYAILSRGKQLVKDIDDVQIGEELQVSIANGRMQAVIKGKEKMRNGEYNF